MKKSGRRFADVVSFRKFEEQFVSDIALKKDEFLSHKSASGKGKDVDAVAVLINPLGKIFQRFQLVSLISKYPVGLFFADNLSGVWFAA